MWIVLHHRTSTSKMFGAWGLPTTSDPAVTTPSREKYADFPLARPPVKFTVPEFRSALMFEKLVFGPSYPVGFGQEQVMKVHSPSPSNPNGCVVPVNARLARGFPLLFCTPMSVSSELS